MAQDNFLHMTPELHEYVVAHGTREDEALRRVRITTDELGDIAIMQIAPDQGAFLTVLARAVGARRALEVGTFTGYSAICLARGVGDGGSLLCCELSEDFAATARGNLEAAGVGERVEIRVGPALATLQALPAEPAFDLAFVDADKPGYAAYFEEILPRLRTGGVVLFDNTLLSGAVLDPGGNASAQALHELNLALDVDERVDLVLLPFGDGLTMLRKR